MQRLMVAVDIGGTKTRVGLFRDGSLLFRTSFATKGLAEVVKALRVLLSRAKAEPYSIGIGAPAPLDMRHGVILNCPNLPHWNGVEVVTELSREFDCEVFLANDATCAAIGELEFGHRSPDFVYITWSTGIGGGIVSGGRVVWGVEGQAGEVGHMVLAPQGPHCRCGKRGCLEALASGTGIARAAAELFGRKLTAATVVRKAQEGDVAAQRLVLRACEAMGQGIGILWEIFEPEMIILGGGLTRSWDYLGPFVLSAAREFSRTPPRVELTPLGDDVGLYGAAALYKHIPDLR
jgi:glucokinase